MRSTSCPATPSGPWHRSSEEHDARLRATEAADLGESLCAATGPVARANVAFSCWRGLAGDEGACKAVPISCNASFGGPCHRQGFIAGALFFSHLVGSRRLRLPVGS